MINIKRLLKAIGFIGAILAVVFLLIYLADTVPIAFVVSTLAILVGLAYTTFD